MAYLLKVVPRVSRSAYSWHTRAFGAVRSPLAYSEEVLRAKAEDTPIVALESTIIAHGMPYPQNLETALQVENIIRDRGAVPATVAILKGQLTIGLTEEQLKHFSQSRGVIKASRRDLAPIAAAQLDGATTVSGTIVAAQLADIPVFVTGGLGFGVIITKTPDFTEHEHIKGNSDEGIKAAPDNSILCSILVFYDIFRKGGVHREGETTMDISADLTELGRSNTLVVCSGVKSILDIGRTLEYLETQGVCVCAFGESDMFPAFYTQRSGHRAQHHVKTAQDAARLLQASRALRLTSGIVVAVPVPKKHAMDESIIEGAIQSALDEANKKGIRGKEVTPFILATIAKVTGGTSLDTNIALIKNNARVGADIAVELKKLKNVDNLENSFRTGFSKGAEKCSPDSRKQFHTSCSLRSNDEIDFSMLGAGNNSNGDVLVIGGSNVDRTYRVTEKNVQVSDIQTI